MAEVFYIPYNKETGEAQSPFGDSLQEQSYSPMSIREGTIDDLREVWNSGTMALQQQFESFDQYVAYMREASQMLSQQLWWEAKAVDLRSPSQVLREGEDLAVSPGQQQIDALRQSDANARNSAYQQWLMSDENQALMQKYGIEPVFYNQDGDQFKWTGAGYVKTLKVDDHADFADYVGAIIKTAVASALVYGATGGTGISSLTKLFESMGMSAAAAGAASSSILSTGLQQAVQGNFDPKSLLANAVGSAISAGLINAEFFPTIPGGAVGAAAVQNALSNAIVQGIMEGSIDLNEVIESGFLGGVSTLATDFIKDFIAAGDAGAVFDLGGLIDPTTGVGKTINDFLTEYATNIKGGLSSFLEQNVTGGSWFKTTDDTYDLLAQTNEEGELTFKVIDYATGEEIASGTLDALEKLGYIAVKGDSAVWDFINSTFESTEEGINWLLANTTGNDKTWDEYFLEFINNQGGSIDEDETPGGSIYTQQEGGQVTKQPVVNELCNSLNRITLPDGSCGGCMSGFEPTDAFEEGGCFEIPVENEPCGENEIRDTLTGECIPDPGYTEGYPCNTAEGISGVYNAAGECIVAQETGDGTENGNAEEDVTGVPTDTEQEPKEGDVCDNGNGTLQKNASGELECVPVQDTVEETQAAAKDCTDPQYAADNPQECGTTTVVTPETEVSDDCSNPTYAEENPDECGTVEVGTQTCENGAVDYPLCTECSDGSKADPEAGCPSITIPTPSDSSTEDSGDSGGGAAIDYKPVTLESIYSPVPIPGLLPTPNIDYVAALQQPTVKNSNTALNGMLTRLLRE